MERLPRLLSSEELAEYLGVPVTTIYRWRCSGTGPRGFSVGRHTKYREADVLDWIESRYEMAAA